MKIFRKFLIVLFILLSAPLFPFGKKDSESDKEKQNVNKTEPKKEPQKNEINDEFIKIDMLLDTKAKNPNNHFNWKAGFATYRDSYDAVSGASKVHSTKFFRDTTFDSSAKALKTPKGLRNLCLFAVSEPEYLKKDDFKIERTGQNGKKLIITFEHRGIFYKIETDDNGVIYVPGSFFIKQTEKNDEKNPLPESQDKKADKVLNDSQKNEKSAEDEFVSDVPSQSIEMIYQGKLRTKLSESGILTIKGMLKLQKIKKEEQNPETEKPGPEMRSPENPESEKPGPERAEQEKKDSEIPGGNL